MRVISRTVAALTMGAGGDRVVAWAPLPEGAAVLGVQGELHVVGEESIGTSLFSGYGFAGQVVPVDDATVALDVQNLWDEAVTKAIDPSSAAGTSTVDMDWDTGDSDPQIEPGEMDVSDLLGLGIREKELIAPRMEWISWAKSRQGGFISGSPDVFHPSDYKTFRSARTIRADVPSMALLGVSNPSLDETQTQVVSLGTVAEWAVLGNLRLAMEQMLIGQIGLTEAGAESPHADIGQFISELAAPDMLTETTSLFKAMAYDVMCTATWLLEMPGSSIPGTIDPR